jgi:hypothetical protein
MAGQSDIQPHGASINGQDITAKNIHTKPESITDVEGPTEKSNSELNKRLIAVFFGMKMKRSVL